MPTALLASLLLGFATVTPTTLPAVGTQHATLVVDRPGLVRIEVRTPVAGSCHLVDQRRGPFTHGTSDAGLCVLEELLDAGTYRVVMDAPANVTGKPEQASIRVIPFLDADARTPRLEPGASESTRLPLETVRHYVVRSDGKRAVRLHVVGRTAGRVELWRDAEWREAASFRHEAPTPTGTGRALHHWSLHGVLEEGAYRLSIYGTTANTWENGDKGDALWVSNGAPLDAQGRSLEVELPWTGLALVDLPVGQGRVVSSVKEVVGKGTIGVDTFAIEKNGVLSGTGSCELSLDPLRPVCSASGGGKLQGSAIEVRGPAGAKVLLSWLPYDAVFGPFAGERDFVGDGQAMRWGVHELPATFDQAPLGCDLVEIRAVEFTRPGSTRVERRLEHSVVGRDLLRIGSNGSYAGKFNYDGGRATIRFSTDLRARHTIEAAGERRSRCVLRDLKNRGAVYETPEGKTGCTASVLLDRGEYELELSGGIQGIEALSIRPNGAGNDTVAGKTGCRFDSVSTRTDSRYDVVATRSVVSGGLRGTSVASVKDALASPFAITLDPGETASFEVPGGVAIQAWSVPGGTLSCVTPDGTIQSTRGTCALPARAGSWTVQYRNPNALPFVLLADRHVKQAAPRLAPDDSLVPPKLPVLALDTPTGRSFTRGERHSFVFDAPTSALYEATTEGLLSTRCDLRTPVILSLSDATGGGRGRNCLVTDWLSPGRYRLVVQTVGQSQGRGLVRLSRSDAIDKGTVAGDDAISFRAPASRLIRQAFELGAAGNFTLQTEVLGASTMCRLENAEGWPLVSVPTSCSLNQAMPPGRFAWLQLPLTVETRRRTSATRATFLPTFEGPGERLLQLGVRRDAVLGEGGKDTYTFEVPARLGITFEIAGELLGQLQRIEGTQRQPLDLLRFGPLQEEPEPYVETEYDDEGNPIERPWSPPPARRSNAPQRTLEPGRYALVVSHVRDDKHIRYSLELTADALAPGLFRETSAPSTHVLKLATTGVVRLRTRGSTDTRCRLFEGDRLLSESTSTGEDWNCTIDAALNAGEYTVVLEAETGTPGPTRIEVTSPETRTLTLNANGTLPLALDEQHVDRLTLPAGDDVVVVEVKSSGPTACALTDGEERLLQSRSGLDGCAFTMRTPSSGARVRFWSTAGKARGELRVRRWPVSNRPAKESALVADVAWTGRYRLLPGVECLRESGRGAFQSCDMRTSLEAGRWLFVRNGGRDEATLGELVLVPIDTVVNEDVALSPGLSEAVSSRDDALHLLSVTSVGQASEAPACGIDGGVVQREEGRCFSAAGPMKLGVQRAFGRSASLVGAIERRAVPLPPLVRETWTGRQVVTWTDEATRGRMPAGAWRVKVLVPAETWAIALVDGKVSEACGPSKTAVQACELTGRGGELVLVGHGERRAELLVTEGDDVSNTRPLDRLVEELPRGPGRVRLQVAASTERRSLQVNGGAGCTVSFDDGRFERACSVEVPAGRRATVVVTHGLAPWRALLAVDERRLASLLGPLPGLASRIESGRGERVDQPRAFDVKVEGPSLLQVRGSGLVCGLVVNGQVVEAQGDGVTCALDEVVPAGTHRIVARPYGTGPGGFVQVQLLPVLTLAEGIGEETWLAPGEVRRARFEVKREGSIGLGLRTPSDDVTCRVLDDAGRVLGVGCQQFLAVKAGAHQLELGLAPSARPLRVRPVLLGLDGRRETIPDDVLADLFARIGATE